MLREESVSPSIEQAAITSPGVEVNVKVMVRSTFIEVIDPQAKKPMSRCLSDSALVVSSACFEHQWQKDTADKFTKGHDVSEASTSICSDSEDAVELTPARVRTDTCWSDDEGAFESTVQPCMPYQYVEYDPNASMVWWVMPDGSAYMPSQWEEQKSNEGESSSVSAQWTESSVSEANSQEWRTTVMIRNMPNNYTREMALELVDDMGFEGCYDFAYLPVDFKSQAGLGYAFINFVTPAEALRCFECFEGFRDWIVPSEKVCTVTWGAPYQGLDAHIERYQNSPIMHHSIPDEWKPILLEGGRRIAFPPPTRPIKSPKFRQQHGSMH